MTASTSRRASSASTPDVPNDMWLAVADRLRGESRPVPSNPMLVWMPLELFALLLNDGLALGPDDGQD